MFRNLCAGVLGPYRIERELGRGAMGAVLLAIDPRDGRRVALKILSVGGAFSGEADAQARERFLQEARTAARLQHPAIVRVLDAGQDQGLAYIAMELASGHDLQRHAQAGQLLPVASVLHCVARVAEALAYAHRQGVVHRDIKPANVIVELAGARGKSCSVKVTDFGIARVADASRTRTGVTLGTPAFMSPEQMAGRHVDGRSDLYSLGVMLFQLLSGRLPHQADTLAALMHQIANDSAPDIRTLRPDLGETLADVVALALQKRPELRYADGAQLALDLQLLERRLPAPMAAKAGPESSRDVDLFSAGARIAVPGTRHNPPH